MAKIIDKLNRRIDRVQRHKKKRQEIMGEHGMIKQDMRNAQAKIKAAVKPGVTVAQAKGRQAIKRVGEYKAATKQKTKIKRMNSPLAKAVHKQKKSQFNQAGKAKQHKADF